MKNNLKLLFVSLGCDKNLVDTEFMLGMLRDDGIEMTDDEQEADIIIVNTCCFINDAKEESINTILEMAELKKEARLKSLIVTGCLAQRYKEEIVKEIPEVDAILGTNSYEDIVNAVHQSLEGKHYENFKTLEGLPTLHTKRSVTTGGHFAYLKIAVGCNKRCTYCIIPYIRGNYRSVPMEDLIEQAKELVAAGAKELILVAQETTLYGVDLYGEKSLHRLLDELNKIEDLFWIRIMYCYPEEIYEGLIDAMIRNQKVCHYLDIPIQHANDTILKRMGRRTSNADLVKIITHLRERIPDITLRTTLICGFPGANGTGTYFVIMNEIAHVSQKVGLASAMAVVLLLIIFACTILQKLFFKYIFRDAESEDESYKAKRARLKAEKQAKKVGKGVA